MKTYTNQKGEEVEIAKMSDGYLSNAYNYFERELEKIENVMSHYSFWMDAHGEMAQHCVEQGRMEVINEGSYIYELLSVLKKEKEKRLKFIGMKQVANNV